MRVYTIKLLKDHRDSCGTLWKNGTVVTTHLIYGLKNDGSFSRAMKSVGQGEGLVIQGESAELISMRFRS